MAVGLGSSAFVVRSSIKLRRLFFGGDTATFHGPQRVSRTSTGTQEAAPTHCCCRGDLGRMKILVGQEDAKYHNGKGPETHLDRDLPKG